MAQQPDSRTSTQPPAQQPTTSTRRSRRTRGGGFQWTPRLIVTLVLILLLVMFSLQNLQSVDVSLVFAEVNIRLIWALLLFGLIGFVLGLIVPRFWHR